jgi:hypothetical protein
MHPVKYAYLFPVTDFDNNLKASGAVNAGFS